MVTYTKSPRNGFRTPSGAVGEAPDGPGAFAQLAADIDNRIGTGGAEYVQTTSDRDALDPTRLYDDKLVKVAANGVTYAWGNQSWRQWSSDWMAYFPTFSGFTLGNGAITNASFRYLAGMVLFRVFVTLGSTSAMPGPLTVSTPVNLDLNTIDTVLASGNLNDGTTRYPLSFTFPTNGQIRPRCNRVSGSNVVFADLAPTIPFTWAAGHTFQLTALGRAY